MWLGRIGPWQVVMLAGLVRAVLICWAEYQDHHLPVKYTDIDYIVFTDAARFVAAGGSPYQRATYRYSPLLAYLLLPNIWLHPAWGKVLFSVSDLAAAGLMHRLLVRLGASRPLRSAALALWLFNPYTATISTRGSCDVLSVLLLLGLLCCLLYGMPFVSGGLYGLAVHFRIYPVIYGPTIGLYLMRRALELHAQRRGGHRAGVFKPDADGRVGMAQTVQEAGGAADPQVQPDSGAAEGEAEGAAGPDLTPGLRQRRTGRDIPTTAALPPPRSSSTDADAEHPRDPRRAPAGRTRRRGLLAGWGLLQPSGGAVTGAAAAAALRPALLFGVGAAASFGLLGALFYRLYGNEFLGEAFLHHLTRKDPRHNFSPYYYPVYLSYGSSSSSTAGGPPFGDREGAAAAGTTSGAGGDSGGGLAVSLLLAGWRAVRRFIPLDEPWRLAMVPQAAALLALAVRFHADLPSAWLLQTWTFVTLNKVVTAQYFVWYLSLLPLALPALATATLPRRAGGAGGAGVSVRALAIAAGAWVAAQLHWLAWGYQLEMRGRSVHVPLWAAGLVFQLANTAVIVLLARALRGHLRRADGCNEGGGAAEATSAGGTASSGGGAGMTFLEASLVLARPPPLSAIMPASRSRKLR